MKKILYILVIMIILGGGILIGYYVIADNLYCRDHEKANPDINFEWSFSDGCMFELPDGTWVNLRDYKNQDEFKIEIEK